MTVPPSFAAVPPLYTPAPYLIAGPSSFLTREQLVFLFADFYASLTHIHTSPQFVFERLVGNLSVPVHIATEKARRAASVLCLRERVPSADVQVSGAQPAEGTDEEVSPGTQAPMHVIRSFDSREGLWDVGRAESNKAFHTSQAPDISRIAVGLTAFHITKATYLIASARVHSSHGHGFSATIGSRSDGLQGKLKYASCSWVELDPADTSIQCGTWSLNEDHIWTNPKSFTSSSIVFSKCYMQPPQVVLWWKDLFLEGTHNRSVRAYTTNISRSAFTLHIDSLRDQNLYGATVSWIAFPADMAGVETGYFETQGSTGDPTLRTGSFEFKQGRFTAPPRVVAGINRFQSGRLQDVHIELKTFDVTKEGMKWRFDSRHDTNIDCAGASFIAIE